MNKLEVKKILINKLKQEIEILSEMSEKDIQDINTNEYMRHMELGNWRVEHIGELNDYPYLQILRKDFNSINHVFFVPKHKIKKGNVL